MDSLTPAVPVCGAATTLPKCAVSAPVTGHCALRFFSVPLSLLSPDLNRTVSAPERVDTGRVSHGCDEHDVP